jgi:hypothetical protein
VNYPTQEVNLTESELDEFRRLIANDDPDPAAGRKNEPEAPATQKGCPFSGQSLFNYWHK